MPTVFRRSWILYLPEIWNSGLLINTMMYRLITPMVDGKFHLWRKHRGFFNAAYSTTKNDKGGFWSAGCNPAADRRTKAAGSVCKPGSIPTAGILIFLCNLNAQISRNFNDKVRLYVGGENLTGYMQQNPIIDVQNPSEVISMRA